MVVAVRKKNKHKALKITAIVTAALIVLLFAASLIVVSINMNKQFRRYDYISPEFTTDYYYSHYEKDYPRKSLTFTSGENTLQGFIYGAENSKGLLVFAHGIGSGHEHYLKNIIWFVDQGWKVFSYDATGSGVSGGESTKGLPQSALDLDAALNYIENDPELSAMPRFLMGHSWGGYAVTAVLNFGHKVDGVASVSGYAEPVGMVYEFASKVLGDAKPLIYPSICLYSEIVFGKYANLSAIDGINKTDVPVLIIHGTEDSTIKYDNSAIIHKRDKITNPNAEFITLEGCTHSGMFYTKQALELKDEVKKAVNRLKEKYGIKDETELAKLHPEELEKIYSSSDRDAINQPNAEFLSVIEEYFSNILEAKKAA